MGEITELTLLREARAFLHDLTSCAFDYVTTIKRSNSTFLLKGRKTFYKRSSFFFFSSFSQLEKSLFRLTWGRFSLPLRTADPALSLDCAAVL